MAILGVDTTLLTQDYGETLLRLGIEPTQMVTEKFVNSHRGQKDPLGIFIAALDGHDVIACSGNYRFSKAVFDEAFACELLEVQKHYDVLVTSSDVSWYFWDALSKTTTINRFGLKCLLTSGLKLPSDYLKWASGSDLLFINKDEANCLGLSPEEFCSEAIAKGARAVFVTLGREGGVCYCGEQCQPTRRVPPNVPGVVVSSVGAGDTFAAGVIYGVMLGLELSKSVDLGLLLAAVKVRHADNILPQGLDVDSIIAALE